MSEKVKVRFSVTLEGSYSGFATISREAFEFMEDEDERSLGKFLVDYIKWGEAEIEVDCVDEFELAGEGEGQ